jgi:hypothetical protein
MGSGDTLTDELNHIFRIMGGCGFHPIILCSDKRHETVISHDLQAHISSVNVSPLPGNLGNIDEDNTASEARFAHKPKDNHN